MKRTLIVLATIIVATAVGCSDAKVTDNISEEVNVNTEITKTDTESEKRNEKLLAKHENAVQRVISYCTELEGKLKTDKETSNLIDINEINFSKENEQIDYFFLTHPNSDVRNLEMSYTIRKIDESTINDYIQNGFDVRNTRFNELQKMITDKDMDEELIDRINSEAMRRFNKTEDEKISIMEVIELSEEYVVNYYFYKDTIILGIIQRN